MSNIQVKLSLSDENKEDEELQEETEYILEDIRQEVEIEDAGLVQVENTEKGAKSIGGFLLGMLTAEVSIENFNYLLRFLGDRLRGQRIELEVTANGKSVKVKASNQAELLAAIKAAQEFIEK